MFGLYIWLTILMAWTCQCQKSVIPSEELMVCSHRLGCLQGTYMKGYDTEKFEAYLGIPYALPPVNELRFSSPKAHPKWLGVLNATQAKSDCIQKNYILPNPQVQGSEDCLYLNVYRPMNTISNASLPVMVYIFGGGWFSGTSNPAIQGPEYFMDTREVILVTFNYRLGAFGFLSTNDGNMPGNFGLKDQQLALRWVQKHISAFNGNPKMVTIFGQSSGAISAHLHVLRGQSEDLFQKLITLSGTANVPFVLTEDPLQQARKLANLLNITNSEKLSTIKLTRALREIDAKILVNAGDGFKYWDVDPMTNFRPVIEKANINEAFLTQHPEKLLAKARYSPVPWLASFVKNEGAVRAIAIVENEELMKSFNENFDELFEKLMEFPKDLSQQRIDEAVNVLIEEYFDGVHEINNETSLALNEIISDRGFLRPYYNAIETYVNTVDTNKFPVFLMNFDYRGRYSYDSLYTGGTPSRDYGVVHCDDLIYLFRSPALFPDFPKRSSDAKVMRAAVGNLVHFAKFSEPRNTEKVQDCNRNTFHTTLNGICDYQQLGNDGYDGFRVSVTDKFPVRRVKLWDTLLGE